jgi:hypothetical protein
LPLLAVLAGPSGRLRPGVRMRFRDSAATNAWVYVLTPSGTDDGTWHHYAIEFDPTWSDAQALAKGWTQEVEATGFATTMASVWSTGINVDGVANIGVDELRFRLRPKPVLYGADLSVSRTRAGSVGRIAARATSEEAAAHGFGSSLTSGSTRRRGRPPRPSPNRMTRVRPWSLPDCAPKASGGWQAFGLQAATRS